MRNLIRSMVAVAVMALALPLLGACDSLKGTTGPDVGTVQSLAVKVCSFLPLASTVASIIDVRSPALNTSAAVAAAICEAIAPKAGPGAGRPTVAGVPIQGTPVR